MLSFSTERGEGGKPLVRAKEGYYSTTQQGQLPAHSDLDAVTTVDAVGNCLRLVWHATFAQNNGTEK